MKLTFIRHGDPNYYRDGLTEKGEKEASLLSDFIHHYQIDDVYQSPLGRARETAAFCLEKMKKEAVTFDWLMEFPADFNPNISESARWAFKTEVQFDEEKGEYRHRGIWDMLPSYYGQHPELFDRNGWRNSEVVKCSDMVEKYDHVVSEFDKLLASYGYERNGDIYRRTDVSNKTAPELAEEILEVIQKDGQSEKNNSVKNLGFFCHFGITCIMLSHIWNVSPFVPLQYLAMAPSSVTEIVTEEREDGIATFRTLRIGDITHLNMGKEEPSFSARFCERFENDTERH